MSCVCLEAESGNNRLHVSSEDVMQPDSSCTLCGANRLTESNSLLRAENNLLRTKFDILLDTVSVP